ncbi:MAG TPA: MerR family transcriptional regulator [Candidatus Dormibacteraeota bacterium]|nr:MerR family transcriptional regulator [Candidatus Dormibacteraeota bacterium]
MEPALYTVGEVATLLGISPHTVRAWERRHGIVKPIRTPAGQRRYRAEDVELLRDVKRAVERDGLSLRVAFETTSGSQAIDRRTARSETGRAGQLSKREGIWHGVVDVLPHLVLLLDARGKIVEANVMAAKEFGVLRQQLRGRLFADLVDPYDRAKAVLLFRPQARAVDGWELNLSTVSGPRLYSFRSWTVGGGDHARLALVGSQMFEPLVASSPALVADAVAETKAPRGAEAPTDALHELVDQLPFGVAVATVGPDPRVVYANLRLAHILGLAPRVFTGRPVQELLPRAPLLAAVHDSTAKKTTQVLKGVTLTGPRHRGRSYNVACQPLLSTAQRVAAILIVLDEATPDAVSQDQLSASLLDPKLDQSATPRQLAQRAVGSLAILLPGVPAAVAVTGARAGSLTVAYSAAAVNAFRRRRSFARAFQHAVRSARAAGAPSETTVSVSGDRHVITLVPFSRGRELGFVAWSRRTPGAATPNAAVVLNSLVPRLRVASDLLHARMNAARDVTRINAMAKAASVVRETRNIRTLGTRFLQQLTSILNADAAAILTIDGPDFVIQTAYAVDRLHVRPGQRFPLTGQFVSRSLKTDAPQETSELGSPAIPGRVNRALSRMKHALSVPIGSVGGHRRVITMLRKADKPFTDDDARIVEALSGTALFLSDSTASRAFG